ncbi:importin subunit alpha [Venturia canescens]|uniref:importin subunit alpha n=1 Tax=Venturia canescens TaxID=32260 RepID=UPI001C9BC301|nr:importin subunit alpha [Venturia canescens]
MSDSVFVNNETLEVIRSQSRLVLNEERKSNRALLWRKKRSALGGINGEEFYLSTKEVVDKAKQLERGALSRKDYLLLQNSLIQNEANVKSFLQANNVLDALMRDLTGANPAVQLIAASCCCNIALANPQVCIFLAKYAGPHLVAELYSLNYPLLEVCAWTIGNLCAGSKTAFEFLYAQGCYQALISLINNCEESVLQSTIYALKFCLYSGHDVISGSEVTDLSTALIRLNHFSHDKENLWILALLSSRKESHNALMSVLEIVLKIVWEIVMDSEATSNDEMLAPGIRLLGNTITESTGRAAKIFINSRNNQDIATFFDKLLSKSENHVKMESFWVFGNFYDHVQPEIRAEVRERLIPLMNSLKHFVS